MVTLELGVHWRIKFRTSFVISRKWILLLKVSVREYRLRVDVSRAARKWTQYYTALEELLSEFEILRAVSRASRVMNNKKK